MSSTTTTADPEIDRILSYWFGDTDPIKKWYMGGAAVDAEIRSQFLPLVTRARAGELTAWRAHPRGSLALLILLDQFPRNLFRGSAESYSSDGMAREVAVEGLAQGFDRELAWLEQSFFITPLVHHEDLISQIAAVALFENLLARSGDAPERKIIEQGINAGKRHLVCIRRFGRFPARNGCVGRPSTQDEVDYLKENPIGF